MDELRAIRYFSATAEAGNFSAAAKRFSVPPSSISRRISDLEESLGAQLLTRTTRSVSLTEVGAKYLQQVNDVLRQLDQCNQSVREYQSEPTGQLKISTMVRFGEQILIPLLEEFSTLYPDVILDVMLTDEISKLDRDDVDIAIRGGYAPDEHIVAVHLLDNRFVAVASHQYLEKFGYPKSTKELPNHFGLYFKTPTGPTPWLSEIDGKWQDVSAPSLLTTNNGEWLSRNAIRGDGIAMMPRWALLPYFERGELIELTFDEPLSISQNQEMGVYMLYQKLAYDTPKVKAAVDFIRTRVRDHYTDFA